jgi:hypothetical protein
MNKTNRMNGKSGNNFTADYADGENEKRQCVICG